MFLSGFRTSAHPRHVRRRHITLALVSLLALACTCTGLLPRPTQPAQPPPPTTEPKGPEQPPPTQPPAPPAQPTQSVWESISGMWSGCPVNVGSSTEVQACALEPEGYPLGPFLTLFLLPNCSVGEMCGSYVKGAFASEFILYTLSLVDIQGSKVLMFGDSGEGMFEGMDIDVEIERMGPLLRITDSDGGTYDLPPGCDPIIDDNFKCWDTVP